MISLFVHILNNTIGQLIVDYSVNELLCPFQWIDGSTYSYRHHRLPLHNETVRQFYTTRSVNASSFEDVPSIVDTIGTNFDNTSCFVINTQFLALYEWIPVSSMIN